MNQDEFMYEKKLTSVVPSARQLALEQMEFSWFYSFYCEYIYRSRVGRWNRE